MASPSSQTLRRRSPPATGPGTPFERRRRRTENLLRTVEGDAACGDQFRHDVSGGAEERDEGGRKQFERIVRLKERDDGLI